MASSSFSFPACASRESVRFISCSTLERGGKKSDVTAAGHRESKGLLAHGGASRLCDFYFLHCFGAIADKTDNKTLSRVHSFFFDRNTI